MDALALLAVVLIAIILAVPISILHLYGRVRKIERQLQGQVMPQAVAPVAESLHPETEAVPETSPAVPSEPSAGERFIEWLKEDWLLKLGGLLLLIGFGWLTTYAFLNDWIGPVGRITLGIVAGSLLLLLGAWRIRAYVHQGGVFLVIGSTTILLTVFAARQVYEFFTPVTALGIMFLASAFVAVASIRYSTRALSLASVILAGIAPLLTGPGPSNSILLFSYLFVVILGVVWIVAVTGQREITAASLILVSFYSVPHIMRQTTDAPTLLLFAYAFAAVFYLVNTIGIVKIRDKRVHADLFVAGGNGLFLLAWIMTTAPEEWQSLIISAWMLLFIGGAFAAFKLTQKREPFYVYAGIAAAMLAAATAAELQGAALTIAYTIECAVLAVVTYMIVGDRNVAERISLLFIGPVILAVRSAEASAWREGILHQHFFVLLVLSLALLGTGGFFQALKEDDIDAKGGEDGMRIFLFVAGSICAAALVWRVFHATSLAHDTATMASLLVYTITGLTAYFFGRTQENKALLVYGGAVLGCVIARLFLIDVWQMALTGRIITFFLVGILLMTTAFFGRARDA